MIIARAILIAFLSVSVAGSASARTPTPTATPTPAPPAIATPVPPQPAVFGGVVWVNAHPVADRDVTAKIGDTVCATLKAPLATPPGGGAPTYGVAVPPENVLPGCGREGATVTFFVGDQQAAQTVEWHAGEDMRVDLTVGPPFARFDGVVRPARITDRRPVVPYVNTVGCGYSFINDTGDGYTSIVYSSGQQAGCGLEGSLVTFKLLDAQGNVVAVANEKGTWHAWDGVSDPQRLDLTFGPATVITMPGTGTGDGSRHAGSAWALLGFVGLAGAVLGLALRKRAMTR